MGSKVFVHLNHSLEPPFLIQGYNISGVHFSSLDGKGIAKI